MYVGYRRAKPKKLRNRGYKVCLNERAIVRLLDAMISCNIDKSIINSFIKPPFESTNDFPTGTAVASLIGHMTMTF